MFFIERIYNGNFIILQAILAIYTILQIRELTLGS